MKCDFCGKEIKPGTGLIYVKKTGKKYTFCSSKCERNMVKLRRKPEKVKWAAKTRIEAR